MTIKTIVSAALPVDERLLIKKNCLQGGTGSKRVCIVTGTHGDELEGQFVAFALSKILGENLDKLNGTVEIYPCLNPLGMDSILRGIPAFDLDMNRIFPGDPEGHLAENTAYAIIEDLKGADLVIDIHSSNLFLREVPQARINERTKEKLMPYAKLLNMDFIWVHESATVLEATLAHSLNVSGTPCVVVEMGVGLRVNHSLGRQLLKGILNLLEDMGIWQGDFAVPGEDGPVRTPLVCEGPDVCFVNASASGSFLTEARNGCYVKKGDHLGDIVNSLTGEIYDRVEAPCDGYLFTIRAFPLVYEGSLVARIYKVEDQ